MGKEKTGLVLSKGYLIVTLFIWCLPNYNSIDVIGSQWFHLGILNLIGLVMIWSNWSEKTFQGLFSNRAVPLFFAFLLWGLGSLFYADNQAEVLIESSRIASLFILLLTLLYLFKRFSISFEFLSKLFFISLILEIAFVIGLTYLEQGTVFGLTRTQLNTGIAANINITSYSILYKLPLVVYLYFQTSSRGIKFLISSSVTVGAFLIFSLSSRSAIISLFLVAVGFGIFAVLKKRERRKSLQAVGFSLFLPVVIAFATAQISSADSNTTLLSDRLATINLADVADESIEQRLSNYTESLKHFSRNPILGMGLGNWKINSIPFSMENKRSYIVPYHVHNDFIQFLAELGLIGFVFYGGFFLVSLLFLIKLFKQNKIPLLEFISLLLFSLIYFMDANFNFPYSRVIIQMYLMICLAYLLSRDSTPSRWSFFKTKKALYLLFLATPFLLYSHYRILNSFIQQSVLMNDFNTSSLSVTSEEVLLYESSYPNISISTLPLKALKANYLINGPKQDLDAALKLTQEGRKDNPYISLPEVMLARIYAEKEQADSAKYFARQAYYMMPSVELNVASYLPFVKLDEDTTELQNMQNALIKSNSKFIWAEYLKTVRFLKDSLTDSDQKLIQIAVERFPDFTLATSFNLTKEYTLAELKKANQLAARAESFFKAKKYSTASKLYSDAYKIIPNEPAYLENQARSVMFDKKYTDAIDLFNKLIKTHNDQSGQPEYYIAAMYYSLNKKEQSCQELRVSIQKGYNPAKSLYEKTCLSN